MPPVPESASARSLVDDLGPSGFGVWMSDNSGQLESPIRYFENLDSLRGIAALAVVFHHVAGHLHYPDHWLARRFCQLLSWNSNAGPSGVYFFFVLSGFLITYLLLAERHKKGKVGLFRFYLRRALRIWPLYYLSLFAGFVLHPMLMRTLGAGFEEQARPSIYGLFLANFDPIYHALPSSGILGVQWSVAVEEQFYLVWPLLFILFASRAQGIAIATVLVLAAGFYTLSDSHDVRYFHTFSAATQLSFGALAGYLCFFRVGWVRTRFEALSKVTILAVYLLGLGFLFFESRLPMELLPVRLMVTLGKSAFFAFVILEQVFASHSLVKLGRFKFLDSLGKISYGIYLLHMIAITLVSLLHDHVVRLGIGWQICLALVGTYVLSYLSFHFWESPFLKLKKKFSNLEPPPEIS